MPAIVQYRRTGAIPASARPFLARHSAAGELLLIAATRTAADELLRSASPAGEGLAGVHRMTLPLLASALAAPAMARDGVAPTTPLAAEALVARVIHDESQRRPLAYFGPVAAFPGFPRAIAATLRELRLAQALPADVAESGAPGKDLARLAVRYAAELSSASLADTAAVLEMAAEAAAEGEHRLIGLPVLLLDTPVRTSQEARLIAALAAQSPAFLALIHEGDRETIALLEACLAVRATAPEPPEPTALGSVRQFLFTGREPASPHQDPSLDLFSAPGEGLECVEIARRLLASGLPFDRAAILLRSPDRYQPLVEEALRRARIPGYFSRGTARPQPGGRALLALLECAAEGCSASRFAEYISLGQVPPLDSSGAPLRRERVWTAAQDDLLAPFTAPDDETESAQSQEGELAAPVFWERLLVDAAVVGGPGRWARRLDGLDRELELQWQRARTETPESADRIERQRDRLLRLRAFALPLIEALSALPEHAKWGEWIERLSALAQTALRDPQPVLSLLSELQPMAAVGPVALDEVYSTLSERLRFLRLDPPARRYGSVFVASIEEARGLHFDVVFLPGLSEGVFPQRAQEDPLLLDEYRRGIALAPALAVQDTRVDRERLLLRIAAAAADRLVISYSRMDSTIGRPRVASFYCLEVMRAAEGTLPDIAAFEKRAASAAPSRLGWPAPVDPLHAVDDAEFDLACLEEIQRLTPAERKGRARHMVESSDWLARSLRTRFRRWSGRWSSADGILDPAPETLALLEQHQTSRRPYSATSLQLYAACPYRFYLSAIAGLRPREDTAALETVDPLTRGALFHRAQFEILAELRRQGSFPLTVDRLPVFYDLADRMLTRVAMQYEEQLAPAIPLVWDRAITEIGSDLRGWLRHCAKGAPLGWEPHKFELAFGLPDRSEPHDASSTPEDIPLFDGALRLRGSIDLVERHAQRGVLRVIDHKTGRRPDLNPGYVGGGSVLQPLLYALAAERLLGETVESGMLSYCTQRGNFEEVKLTLTATARERIAQAIAIPAQAIAAGSLPAAPAEDECSRCDYHPVCGPYEEQRTSKNPMPRIAPLLELRKLP